MDMLLTEIEDFLKSKDIDRIVEKLRQQKHAVLKKQQELKRIEQKIDHRLNWLMVARNRRNTACGLVNDRKEGKWHHYSLNCETLTNYKKFIENLACEGCK